MTRNEILWRVSVWLNTVVIRKKSWQFQNFYNFCSIFSLIFNKFCLLIRVLRAFIHHFYSNRIKRFLYSNKSYAMWRVTVDAAEKNNSLIGWCKINFFNDLFTFASTWANTLRFPVDEHRQWRPRQKAAAWNLLTWLLAQIMWIKLTT